MKTMAIEKLGDHISDLESLTPTQRVLLTKNGKPFAIVSDASNLDEEDIGYINDPSSGR